MFFVILLFSALFTSCSFDDDDDDSVTGTTTETSDLTDPSPSNGATGQSLVVTLSWDYEGDDASSYDVYFEDNSTPSTQIASERTSKSIIMPGLDYSTTYYWQVFVNTTDGDQLEGPVWHFTTKSRGTTEDGYVMVNYGLETEKPSYVKILFQVLDLNGIGVDDLTTSDFELYEDGVEISSTESDMEIKKRDELSYTLNLVLMLDNSTSLQDDFSEIKSGAIDLVNSLGDQFQMAVYKFSEDPELVQDFTSDKSTLIAAINSLSIEYPTTDLYGAVIEGADAMEEEVSTEDIQQSAMILFTDGDDTQGEHTYSEAINAISSKRVYTVGLGSDIQTEVLESIGNAGFFAIGDVSELSDAFLDIEDELEQYANSFYQLVYVSPKRGNNDHELLLQIKDNPNSSYISGTFNSSDFFSSSTGLYINADEDNTEGISEITLSENGVKTVTAYSFYVDSEPVYKWTSLATNIVTVEVDDDDDSRATIEAVGTSGQSGVIRIQDTANGLTALLTVYIK